MKLGIVDVGGGYRGIYAAGVLDHCMDRQVDFDLAIGVSAGSANLISYAARQPRRNLKFYSEYGLRHEAASLHSFLHNGSFLDLDYLYSTLSNQGGENPLDHRAFLENPMDFYAVATVADTGEPVYFGKQDIPQDDYSALKASCALPFFCHPYAVKGVPCFDGGVSDPIPIDKAFELGCDKVVLLLTLPLNTVRRPDDDERVARLMDHPYPKTAQQLRRRAQRYNETVRRALEYEKQGDLLIIAPDDTCGVTTLSREPEALLRFYLKGLEDGKKVEAFVRGLGK